MKTKVKRELMIITDAKNCHLIWHKFSGWIAKTYGKDLLGELQVTEWTDESKKKHKWKTRSFNDLELSRRLVGYEVMRRVQRYTERYCPQIKRIPCDDSSYSGSDIYLIPHPKHGITIMFIPQCTTIQNQIFLYESHCELLIKELSKMKRVYKN